MYARTMGGSEASSTKATFIVYFFCCVCRGGLILFTQSHYVDASSLWGQKAKFVCVCVGENLEWKIMIYCFSVNWFLQIMNSLNEVSV